MILKSGMRNDGSRRYGTLISNPNDSSYYDWQFQNTFERIAEGSAPFVHTQSQPTKESLQELETFLNYAKKHNIHVIGFLPPFAQAAHDRTQQDQRFGYLYSLHTYIEPIFQANNFPFYDATTMSMLGGTDEEMIDGFHGSEISMARILLHIAKQDDILKSELNIELLNQKMQNKPNKIQLFEDDL